MRITELPSDLINLISLQLVKEGYHQARHLMVASKIMRAAIKKNNAIWESQLPDVEVVDANDQPLEGYAKAKRFYEIMDQEKKVVEAIKNIRQLLQDIKILKPLKIATISNFFAAISDKLKIETGKPESITMFENVLLDCEKSIEGWVEQTLMWLKTSLDSLNYDSVVGLAHCQFMAVAGLNWNNQSSLLQDFTQYHKLQNQTFGIADTSIHQLWMLIVMDAPRNLLEYCWEYIPESVKSDKANLRDFFSWLIKSKLYRGALLLNQWAKPFSGLLETLDQSSILLAKGFSPSFTKFQSTKSLKLYHEIFKDAPISILKMYNFQMGKKYLLEGVKLPQRELRLSLEECFNQSRVNQNFTDFIKAVLGYSMDNPKHLAKILKTSLQSYKPLALVDLLLNLNKPYTFSMSWLLDIAERDRVGYANDTSPLTKRKKHIVSIHAFGMSFDTIDKSRLPLKKEVKEVFDFAQSCALSYKYIRSALTEEDPEQRDNLFSLALQKNSDCAFMTLKNIVSGNGFHGVINESMIAIAHDALNNSLQPSGATKKGKESFSDDTPDEPSSMGFGR